MISLSRPYPSTPPETFSPKRVPTPWLCLYRAPAAATEASSAKLEMSKRKQVIVPGFQRFFLSVDCTAIVAAKAPSHACEPDHPHWWGVTILPARSTFQRRLKFPDRRVPRPANAI